jgi:hypothetical protein
MFVEYVTAGMLWSPSTHFVNALSNGANNGESSNPYRVEHRAVVRGG